MLSDPGAAAQGRHGPERAVLERLRRAVFQMGEDVLRQDLRFPNRELSERGRIGDIRIAGIAEGNVGIVSQRPDVIQALNSEATINDDFAAIQLYRQRPYERRWRIADGGDDRFRVDDIATVRLDPAHRRALDAGLQQNLDTTTPQLVGGVMRDTSATRSGSGS